MGVLRRIVAAARCSIGPGVIGNVQNRSFSVWLGLLYVAQDGGGAVHEGIVTFSPELELQVSFLAITG